jgi:putative endonuclease
MTNHIVARASQHREGSVEGFTYFEEHATALDAIAREKTLKRWPRAWKIALIERTNPNWDDPYDAIARWA